MLAVLLQQLIFHLIFQLGGRDHLVGVGELPDGEAKLLRPLCNQLVEIRLLLLRGVCLVHLQVGVQRTPPLLLSLLFLKLREFGRVALVTILVRIRRVRLRSSYYVARQLPFFFGTLADVVAAELVDAAGLSAGDH